jgi:anti-sigma B factor antagonist
VSPDFAIAVHREPDLVRLGLTGEIDLAAVPAVRAAVLALVADPDVGAIIVDLSETTFLDSSGIGELVRSQRLATEAGTRLQVTGARNRVAAVLELTGLVDLLAGRPSTAAGGTAAGGTAAQE